MKKTIIAITLIFTAVLIAPANAVDNSYEYKIGLAYSTEQKKLGWQFAFDYYYEFDPYIVLGLEPGIYWLNWEKKVGKQEQGNVTADVKADSNAYMFPLMVNGQIRLPNLRGKVHFLPHITVGLGYSFMIYNFKQPEYIDSDSGLTIDAQDKTKLYTGLTWQILAGGTFRPGPESAFGFLFELGYRGAKVKKSTLEVDMTSFIINIGVRYPFGRPRPGGYSI